MDPATLILKEGEELRAMSASHVDDTLTIAEQSKSDEISDFMSKHFNQVCGSIRIWPQRKAGSVSEQDGFRSDLEVLTLAFSF